jgi:hypothetical protein
LTAEGGAAAGAAALTTWACLPSFKMTPPKTTHPKSPEAMLLQQQMYLTSQSLLLQYNTYMYYTVIILVFFIFKYTH